MAFAASWDRERSVHRIADTQFGLFTAGQWYQSGLSREQLRNRLARGAAKRVFNKIYALSTAPENLGFRVMAGCLRSGPLSAASHGTAAGIWSLMKAPEPSDVVHIATPRRLDPIYGYRFHRVALSSDVVSTKDGLPVTDVARTLLDACAELHERRSGMLIDRALREGMTSVEELTARVTEERRRGRSGVAAMCAHIESRDPSNVQAHSDLEQQVFDFLLRSGFPRPERNYLFASLNGFPWELDLYWPAHKLVIEVDAFSTHGGFESFHKDREKDLELKTMGLEVVHVTNEMLRRETKLRALLQNLIPRV